MKLFNWGGKNKELVRDFKVDLIMRHLKTTGQDPLVLTFPGARALLEKKLISSGVNPNRIVGIQRLRTAKDRQVVQKLITDVMMEGQFFLPMFIGEFRNLPSALLHKSFPHDRHLPMPCRLGAWCKDNPNPRFNVLELDFCGPFGPDVLSPVQELFRNKMVSDDTLLIVNHQKGRERPKLLEPYLRIEEKRLGLRPPPVGIKGARFRYNYIPAFYHRSASLGGYSCFLHRVFEYRDKSDGSKRPVTMIQYVFRVRAAEQKSKAAMKATATRHVRRIMEEMKASSKAKSFHGTYYHKEID